MRRSLLALSCGLLVCAYSSRAAVIAVGDSGSHAASQVAVLGGYTMSGELLESRPVDFAFNKTSTDPGTSPVITFDVSHSLRHATVSGWATWSDSESPMVYFNPGSSATYTLPAGYGAIDFYTQPDSFSTFDISVNAGGTILSQSVSGSSGAKYFGFYTDNNTSITSFTITIAQTSGYAVGEFRVGALGQGPVVPEPGTIALLGLGLVAVRRRRR